MTTLKRLAAWFMKPEKLIPLAESHHVHASREEVNIFLARVLAHEEREYVESYFISDEATIYDCSMDVPATWIANCKSAFKVDITDQLHWPVWELALFVKDRQ